MRISSVSRYAQFPLEPLPKMVKLTAIAPTINSAILPGQFNSLKGGEHWG
jgi:hypothetical protein